MHVQAHVQARGMCFVVLAVCPCVRRHSRTVLVVYGHQSSNLQLPLTTLQLWQLVDDGDDVTVCLPSQSHTLGVRIPTL